MLKFRIIATAKKKNNNNNNKKKICKIHVTNKSIRVTKLKKVV